MGNEDIITLDFKGKSLETFQQDGEYYVSVRSIANGIGLHVGAQQRKLMKNHKKFNCTLKRTLAADGKDRELHCIPVKKVPGWLFTIDPERCKETVRPAVELYQEKCFEVLHDYWHGKPATATPQLPAIPRKRKIIKADLVIVYSDGGTLVKSATPANIDKVLAHLAPKWTMVNIRALSDTVQQAREGFAAAVCFWDVVHRRAGRRQEAIG